MEIKYWDEKINSLLTIYEGLTEAAHDIHGLSDFTIHLIETLQFYANPDNYIRIDDTDVCSAEVDGGQRARDILKERL